MDFLSISCLISLIDFNHSKRIFIVKNALNVLSFFNLYNEAGPPLNVSKKDKRFTKLINEIAFISVEGKKV